jgi:hypothetical protein
VVDLYLLVSLLDQSILIQAWPSHVKDRIILLWMGVIRSWRHLLVFVNNVVMITCPGALRRHWLCPDHCQLWHQKVEFLSLVAQLFYFGWAWLAVEEHLFVFVNNLVLITCSGALRRRCDLNAVVQTLVNFGTQRLNFFLWSLWDTLLVCYHAMQ